MAMVRPGPALLWLAAIASVALAGCGFRPLYGETSEAAPAALAEVAIDRIDDRVGQMMRNQLLDKINPRGAPSRPKYLLTVKLTESTERIGLRQDATATRVNLRMNATYQLRRVDGGVVFRSTSAFTGSYNVLLNDFATLSSENDARRRVVQDLSEEIKNRVAIHLSRPPVVVVEEERE